MRAWQKWQEIEGEVRQAQGGEEWCSTAAVQQMLGFGLVASEESLECALLWLSFDT